MTNKLDGFIITNKDGSVTEFVARENISKGLLYLPKETPKNWEERVTA